ncbi:hypothetical protein LCGC14_2374160 [marine sediment metagenome]|uniref:Uncharacterized protein n=1 Tax=marine sediment metagenome TaxID=412755 RepID=A0A0F9EF95_9ZZZZ
MPGVTVGRYPGDQTAGTQVSSTYEGRHLTVLESEMTHPYIADGFVNKGDPVILIDDGVPTTYGNIVGVAFNSAAAATDYIALDTEGIWNLTVYAENDAGNVAIEIGDKLYIRAGSLPGAASADGTGDAEISKITNQAFQVFFGYALGSMVSGGSGVIAVKVHASPSMDNSKRTYITVADGAYVYGKHHTAIFAGGQSTGLEYFDQQVTGVQDGELYGLSSWMELAAGFSITGGQTVVGELGLYDAGGTLTNMRLVMLQMQAILASNPGTSLHIFRINVAAAGGAITAIYAAANPTSLGYVENGVETSTILGSIPFASIVGAAADPVWIRVYDAAA